MEKKMKEILKKLNYKPTSDFTWLKDNIELIFDENTISVANIKLEKDRKLYKGVIPDDFENFISQY